MQLVHEAYAPGGDAVDLVEKAFPGVVDGDGGGLQGSPLSF